MTFTVYDRWHPACPLHLQPWQAEAIVAWRNRDEDTTAAADNG